MNNWYLPRLGGHPGGRQRAGTTHRCLHQCQQRQAASGKCLQTLAVGDGGDEWQLATKAGSGFGGGYSWGANLAPLCIGGRWESNLAPPPMSLLHIAYGYSHKMLQVKHS